MILRSLSRRERNAYERALCHDAINMRVHVTMRDQNEKAIGSLTAETDEEKWRFRRLPGIIDGQVDVDVEAEPDRQLSLQISDPGGKLIFDKNHPSSSGIFPDRFVSVEHSTWVDAMDDWVDVPVFWGPIVSFDRDNAVVNLEAQGKEAVYLGGSIQWKPLTIERGNLVTDAIKIVLREHGERRFDFPDSDRKLPRDFSIGRHKEPWRVCKAMANSIDRQLFFDGAGRCRLRKFPENPTITLFDGWHREEAN